MKKYHKSVFKSFMLISQLGVSVMVPIALCVAVGVYVDRRFETWWTIPLLFIGIAAGVRNGAVLIMKVLKDDERTDKTRKGDVDNSEEE